MSTGLLCARPYFSSLLTTESRGASSFTSSIHSGMPWTQQQKASQVKHESSKNTKTYLTMWMKWPCQLIWKHHTAWQRQTEEGREKRLNLPPNCFSLWTLISINNKLTRPDFRTRPSSRSTMYTSSPGVTPSDACWSRIHLLQFPQAEYRDKR